MGPAESGLTLGTEHGANFPPVPFPINTQAGGAPCGVLCHHSPRPYGSGWFAVPSDLPPSYGGGVTPALTKGCARSLDDTTHAPHEGTQQALVSVVVTSRPRNA